MMSQMVMVMPVTVRTKISLLRHMIDSLKALIVNKRSRGVARLPVTAMVALT